ncbi:unnamed protein product [Clonostachys rosea f. rosea IK726]|uniref:Uncharacterized protein n=1 Tax=Clonostachys rosea f. rosea IK726 TaxID=1349383 RepID=A0ACA9U649_BIOOC|nr:unnamed protein product [Clonostachys rosea f. rosea IK726]
MPKLNLVVLERVSRAAIRQLHPEPKLETIHARLYSYNYESDFTPTAASGIRGWFPGSTE